MQLGIKGWQSKKVSTRTDGRGLRRERPLETCRDKRKKNGGEFQGGEELGFAKRNALVRGGNKN